MMNLYLIKSKVDLIKEAQQDFLNLYGKECNPFTRKVYFYFFVQDNKKYIHKKALQFIYTNAETYTSEVDPYYCNLTKSVTPAPNVEPFLSEYSGSLLPRLLEDNDKFFVYEYVNGHPIESVSLEEFYYLKLQHDSLDFTPFYNSMTYNLIRTDESIKLIDFKHFDHKKDLPFFVYLYNEDNRVNTLYIEKNTDTDSIAGYLGIDYPVKDAKIIEY
jgi:hypothetical protein